MIINLTPQVWHIYDAKKQCIESFEPSGKVARIAVSAEKMAKDIHGFSIVKTICGEVEGLPAYEKGTYYIVTPDVQAAVPERLDLLVPAVPETVTVYSSFSTR